MPQALLFIPDISGYTKFVTETEINHQKHILTELLDILIDANDIGLELAEVEGDALFYYKVGDDHNPQEILNLVKKMYLRFHNHLRYYDSNRICHCGACEGATGLQLKFVMHRGPIDFLSLKGQKPKPHGKEVITIHRLLKNKIDSDEYLLFTDSEVIIKERDVITIMGSEDVGIGSEDYGERDIGSIAYRYTELGGLRKLLDDPKSVKAHYESTSPIVVETEINKDALSLFEIIINFEHRINWNKALDSIKYDDREMNKNGSKHLCIIKGDEIEIETVKVDKEISNWIYGEKTLIPRIAELYNYIIIIPKNGNSEVMMEAHFKPRNVIGRIMIPIFKRRFKKILSESLENLKEYAHSLN